MNIDAFLKLCNVLVQHGGLKPTKRMSVEEQVARFLHIVGNDLRNRMISWVYRRSESSTSRSFHRVLRAILANEDHYLQQPSGQTVAKEIREKSRFYPYFQDCVGAIDGTHARVNKIFLAAVAKPDAIKWKTKKIHNYNELSELFSKDRATGAAAGIAKEKKKQLSKATFEQQETLEEVDRLLSTNKVTLENLIIDDDVFVSSMPASEELHTNSSSSKNKKRKREEEEEMTNKIIASLEVVGEAIKEGNAILKDCNTIMERSRQRV